MLVALLGRAGHHASSTPPGIDSTGRARPCPPSYEGERPYGAGVGLPERLLDRQLAKGRGEWPERLKAARLTQDLLMAATALGLVAAAQNLWGGLPVRPFWVFSGLFWLTMGYVLIRQRRHLDQRSRHQAGPLSDAEADGQGGRHCPVPL